MSKAAGKKPQDTDEITVLDKSKKRPKSPASNGERGDSIGFTVIHGSEVDFGKHFNFDVGPVTIGRDTTNSITLKDEKISKHHCEIHMIRNRELEQITIEDLGSTNGTYVNGQFIRQGVIRTGDKIGIGDTVLALSYNDELEEEYHSRLFSFAATDALTGLYNRRYILNELENQARIARRNNRRFSVAVLDIDNFKQINDVYGHLAGDEFLKKLAFTINHSLREQDICGRYGGEEFLIILPETDIEGAYNLANRVREQIHSMEIFHQGKFIKTTISAGISQFPAHAHDSRELFRVADLALQQAKETGKNKVVRAEINEP